MNRHFLLSVLFLLGLLSCNKKNDPTTITLITTGYPDSTMLFLGNRVIVDTGYVMNNKLVFTVPLTTEPCRYGLYPVIKTRADMDFREVWKDDKAVTVHVSKGNLKNAVVVGAEIQKYADEIRALQNPIRQTQDSLNTIIWSLDPVKDSVRRKELINACKATYPISNAIDSGFVSEHPNTSYSAYMLNNMMKEMPTDLVKKLYGRFSSEVKASSYGLTIKKYIAAAKDVKVGDSAINFSLPNLDGQSLSLNSFKGNYLLLEFWASDCGPCRMENPNLLKNFQKYHNKGFEILGVTFDESKDRWSNAVKKDSMIWNTVGDLNGFDTDVALVYKVFMIPTNYLINPQGIVIAKNLRGDQLGIKLDSIFK